MINISIILECLDHHRMNFYSVWAQHCNDKTQISEMPCLKATGTAAARSVGGNSCIEMYMPLKTEAALRSFCLCSNTARVEAALRSFYEAAVSGNSSIALHVSPKLRLRLRKTEAAFRSLVET